MKRFSGFRHVVHCSTSVSFQFYFNSVRSPLIYRGPVRNKQRWQQFRKSILVLYRERPCCRERLMWTFVKPTNTSDTRRKTDIIHKLTTSGWIDPKSNSFFSCYVGTGLSQSRPNAKFLRFWVWQRQWYFAGVLRAPNSTQLNCHFRSAELSWVDRDWSHIRPETTVWQLQSKVVQTVQQHCLIWIHLDT